MSIKTILILLVAVGAIITGGFFLSSYSNTYEVTVESELDLLEAELANIDAQVTNGSLTPEAALVARTNVLNRLASIDSSIAAAGNASLSESQKAQLASGLTRLRSILVAYQDTLVAVDTTASKHRSTNKKSQSLSDRFLEVIDTADEVAETVEVEVVVEASIEEALDVIEAELDETIEEVVEDVTEEPLMDTGTTSTSTLDAPEDEDTSTAEEATESTEENTEPVEEVPEN